MATARDFLRFVLPYAPGAAEIAVTRYIVDSSVDFCMKTGVWRETLDLQGTKQGVADVELDLPTDSQLVEVTEAYHKQKRLVPKAPDAAYETNDHLRQPATQPEAYLNTVPGVLTLLPPPAVTEKGVLRIKVKLAPSRNAGSLPELLLERYPTVIAHGALGRLLMEPHQIYSDAKKALMYMELFEEALPKARKEAQEGFNRATFRARPVYF